MKKFIIIKGILLDNTGYFDATCDLKKRSITSEDWNNVPVAIIPTIKIVKYSLGRIKLTIIIENTMEKKEPDNFRTNEVPSVTFFAEGSLPSSFL